RVLANLAEPTEERLAVEPSLAHIRDLVLDATLVLWMLNARGVAEHSARLHVLRKRASQRWRRRIRAHDHRRRVVGDDALHDAVEEPPRRVEASADVVDRLRERRPHERVPAEHERHDERVKLASHTIDLD